MTDTPVSPLFMLGLPYLANNDLLAAARRLGATVLVSANAFSRWNRQREGVVWQGFNLRALQHAAGIPIALDSAGFVAAVKYRRFPWRVDDYLDLCAAWPWLWFASMDLCVEPEIAGNEEIILHRISGTVRLNTACLNGALDRGIEDRLLPVIQGWRPDHYLRCIDRMTRTLDGRTAIGAGRMCRRNAEGPNGVIQILDTLDRAYGSDPVRFHLFGLKSSILDQIGDHPRLLSVDSQAYGIAARQAANQHRKIDCGFSKINRFTAQVMTRWYREQSKRLRTPRTGWHPPSNLWTQQQPAALGQIESRYQDTAEEFRRLHEAGEIDFGDLNPRLCFEAAFCCDDD